MPDPTLRELLAAAVAAVGGEERPGQVQMAAAVADAMDTGEHLLVQAGTGTGKSLAYLVPALMRSRSRAPVVVATATLALQAQIVDRDLPRLLDALAPLLGRRPAYAMLKGRRNYLCRNRLHGGLPPDEGEALFTPAPTTALGRDLVRLGAWAEETGSGDRDELVPGVSERAWAQVSVSARECVGAAKCPYGGECFAEQARARAAEADLVVTNHALLAIDALEGIPVLPEHDVVIVDEAHELVDRVTAVASDELSPAAVDRAVSRSARLVSPEEADALAAAGGALAAALPDAPDGPLVHLPEALGTAVTLVADSSRAALSALQRERGVEDDAAGKRRVAAAALEAVHQVAERIAAASSYDVRWVNADARAGPTLRVAPLSVAGLLREKLFGDRTVVLTSATLTPGGSFDLIALGLGLETGPAAQAAPAESAPAADGGAGQEVAGGGWRGLDVGSPFDYPRQGILYVARQLPPPRRDGLAPEVLDEFVGLVSAAGGRTLGLFSSLRGAEEAAAALRSRVPYPVLCQGEDATGQLVRRFAASAQTCLFGTLSLWQGVDVPGPALQLVVIDRIPFPRPDDPLMSARARAVAEAGGNGFLSVSAAHAALRLAQGAGRLIRSASDRGVVAVLDSRLATARYAPFLLSSLPPFWRTHDGAQVRRSLAAIDAAAGPVPVQRAAPPRKVVRQWERRAG